MVNFYEMDFMKEILILVKVDETCNIFKSAASHWSRDEDGIWMIIECQYFYYSPPY